jgi:hypothetical protein
MSVMIILVSFIALAVLSLLWGSDSRETIRVEGGRDYLIRHDVARYACPGAGASRRTRCSHGAAS